MKNLPYLSGFLLGVALLVGCRVAPTASRTAPKAKPAPAPVAKQEPAVEAEVEPRVVSALEPAAARCPLAMPGVTIAAENSHMGAALIFIGAGDPRPLRGDVSQMADAHNRVHAAMGALPGEAPPQIETVTVPRPEEDGPVPVAPEEPGQVAQTEPVEEEEGPDALMNPYEDKADATLASGGATARAEGSETPSMTDQDLTIVKTHSRARADEHVENGVRLVFVAAEDDVESLREDVRSAAADLSEACGVAPIEEID